LSKPKAINQEKKDEVFNRLYTVTPKEFVTYKELNMDKKKDNDNKTPTRNNNDRN
jgi:hypothetical protein